MDISLTIWEKLWAYWLVVLDTILQKWSAREVGGAADVCHESIKGKTCIVTGPTSGIGLETARELVKKGALVVLACRNTTLGDALAKKFREEYEGGHVEVMELDLSSLHSVRTFASGWGNRPLHVLINNAGMFSMAGRLKVTSEGFEEHVAVNYLAPSLLTLVLLPAMKQTGEGRVINVNSVMHGVGDLNFLDLHFTGGRAYNSASAYGQSKLAQLLFSLALHSKLPPEWGIDVVAVHPGEVVTNVGRSLPLFLQWLYKNVIWFCFNSSQGARVTLYCATQPVLAEFGASSRLPGSEACYWIPSCRPTKVSKHSRKKGVEELVWEETLKLISIPREKLGF